MILADFPPSPVPKLNRNFVIGGSVVLLHLAALWALQSGLLRRTVEVVVPAAMLSDIVAPPPPRQQAPAQPAPSKPAEPVRQPVAKKMERTRPRIAPRPEPARAAVPAPAALPETPTSPQAQAPTPPAIDSALAALPAAPSAATVPTRVERELPSSDADYLRNPAPAYPPISKRLGEQGKVLVRVLIGADGLPRQAELKRSSGFERLDRSALEYVMKCRYAPGKVGGVAQAMWHEAPVNFILE